MCSTFSFEFIYNHIANINKTQKEYTNLLISKYFLFYIVIDDFISEINKQKTAVEIQKLAFNRRHLLDNGIISILITCI
jgi:uncharacterized membrane protein YobD (UPF0266 family)